MTTDSTSADDATRRDGSALSEGLGPLGEPLFLLHTGALFGNERDEWEVEANSQAAVDELAEAQPLGTTLHLYALSPEDVAAVNAARKERASKALRRLDLCRCDHNEYCGHCFPVEFRPGGVWGGPNVRAKLPAAGQLEHHARLSGST